MKLTHELLAGLDSNCLGNTPNYCGFFRSDSKLQYGRKQNKEIAAKPSLHCSHSSAESISIKSHRAG